jgi:hypothetical protein
MTDYTGQTAVDGDGREYEIIHHHKEADELTLKRGDITTAITLMDVADGPYSIEE